MRQTVSILTQPPSSILHLISRFLLKEMLLIYISTAFHSTMCLALFCEALPLLCKFIYNKYWFYNPFNNPFVNCQQELLSHVHTRILICMFLYVSNCQFSCGISVASIINTRNQKHKYTGIYINAQVIVRKFAYWLVFLLDSVPT